MRGALAVPLLAMTLILTGCEDPAAPPKRNGADERDGRVAMAFDEYAFRPELPKDAFVCAAMSDTHPHGFFFRVGARYADCDAARDAAANDRWVAVWADHNAMEHRSLKDAGCTPEVPNAALTPMVDKWRKLGMEVEQCAPAGSRNGTIELKLLSPGREAIGKEALPRFLYTFRMESPDRHFGGDLSLFARMLESAEFGAPD